MKVIKQESYAVSFTVAEMKEAGSWEQYASELRSIHANPDGYPDGYRITLGVDWALAYNLITYEEANKLELGSREYAVKVSGIEGKKWE